jgi:hypothetical protein
MFMFLYVCDLFHILLSCDKIMEPWNVCMYVCMYVCSKCKVKYVLISRQWNAGQVDNVKTANK